MTGKQKILHKYFTKKKVGMHLIKIQLKELKVKQMLMELTFTKVSLFKDLKEEVTVKQLQE